MKSLRLEPVVSRFFHRASEVAMTVAGTPTYMAPEIQDGPQPGWGPSDGLVCGFGKP